MTKTKLLVHSVKGIVTKLVVTVGLDRKKITENITERRVVDVLNYFKGQLATSTSKKGIIVILWGGNHDNGFPTNRASLYLKVRLK